jgi:transcriptional regulator with XRE-family HTH domain
MDDEKIYLGKNIKRLMDIRGIPSLTQLAERCAGEITTRSLGGLVNYPTDNNPTLEKLQTIARAFRVRVWSLLVDEFPFEEATQKPQLKNISAAGYRLLALFESASPEKQQSMLDYVAFQLKDTAGERKIRETQHRYAPSKANSPKPYPGCDEDFG